MKTKILLLIAVPVVLAINGFSQNSNVDLITQTRTSKPYHHLHIKGEMNVKLVQGVLPGVTVEGTPYQIGNTVTMLRNDTLYVYQTNTRKGDSKTYVIINVDELVSLDVNGKSKVNCSSLVNTDYLTIRANGGAQIKLDVRALKVDSRATGCGYIDLSGSTVSTIESMDECSIIDSRSLDVLEKRNTHYFCYGC